MIASKSLMQEAKRALEKSKYPKRYGNEPEWKRENLKNYRTVEALYKQYYGEAV